MHSSVHVFEHLSGSPGVFILLEDEFGGNSFETPRLSSFLNYFEEYKNNIFI